MTLYRDQGVVLRTIRLGEADRIITLVTRGHGKVRAVAKGVRKTKSRFGGRLEPFTRTSLMIYQGRRELDTITSADIMSSFDIIRTDYVRLTAAASLVELVDKITPDRERAADTYVLLLTGLQALVDGRTESVVPAFFVKLLSISGYHPQLGICSGCGANARLSGFSAEMGGVVCEDCWHEDERAMRLSPAAIALMARLLAADFGERADPTEADEVTSVMRRYAEFHLERPLRSLRA